MTTLSATGQTYSSPSNATGFRSVDLAQPITPHQLRAPTAARDAVARAQTALWKGKLDEANRHLSRALDAYPHYAIALAIRAGLLVESARFNEAVVDLEDAIQTDPSYGPPYIILGSIYNQTKHYDDALVVLTKGLQMMPSAWQTHFQLANALFFKGKDQESLREIDKAIHLFSDADAPADRALVHFWRAHVLVQLREFAAAEPEYRLVIKQDPSSDLAGYAQQALSLIPVSAIQDKAK